MTVRVSYNYFDILKYLSVIVRKDFTRNVKIRKSALTHKLFLVLLRLWFSLRAGTSSRRSGMFYIGKRLGTLHKKEVMSPDSDDIFGRDLLTRLCLADS